MPTAAMANILVFTVVVALVCLAVIISSLVWLAPYRERTHGLFAVVDQLRELRIAIVREGIQFMSKTAELNQAIGDLSTAANAVAAAIQAGGANTTPDADVAAAVTSIQGITGQLNTVAGGTPTPNPAP